MVSFADSLSAKDADKLYKFGEYTRVGFVKGLHIGDSLYILTNGFENMEASKLDTAVIRANYKATSNEFNIIDLKAEHTDIITILGRSVTQIRKLQLQLMKMLVVS
jgi:hypothetical protein